VADDAVPQFERGQLLRSIHQSAEEQSDFGERCRRPAGPAVRAGNSERYLSCMLDEGADAGEQKRPAGDRLEVLAGLGEADK